MLWWASWRRSKLLPCGFLPAAFAPHQAFCTAKPCRRRNSLPPRIEIYARGPRKMLRHFVGSAKAAGRAAYCSGGPAGGGVSSYTQTKIKRWPQGHLFLQRWRSGSPRPVTSVTGLAMTPQKFTLSFRTSAHTGVGIRSPCRSGRPCPPGSGSAALCRTGPTCPATRRVSRAGRCGHRPLRNDDKKCCA